MRIHIIACLVLASFAASDRTSQAVPISTKLTLTGASGANLFMTTLGGAVTASLPIDLTGTIDVTIREAINYASYLYYPTNGAGTTGIALTGADIDLSDQSLDLSLGFLGGVEGALTGAGINTLDSHGNIALTYTHPADPFQYTFDPGGGVGGTDLAIDQGLFTYNGTGPVGGLLGSGTVDFSTDPVNATLDPIGQIGLLTLDIGAHVGNTVTVDIVVSAPLTFVDQILTDPLTLDVDLSGALIATGFYTFLTAEGPEPSSIVLMSIALVALIPLRRRMIRRYSLDFTTPAHFSSVWPGAFSGRVLSCQ